MRLPISLSAMGTPFNRSILFYGLAKPTIKRARRDPDFLLNEPSLSQQPWQMPNDVSQRRSRGPFTKQDVAHHHGITDRDAPEITFVQRRGHVVDPKQKTIL